MRGPNAVERCRAECTFSRSRPSERDQGVRAWHGPLDFVTLYFIFMERACGGELLDQVVSANALPEVVARGFSGSSHSVEYLHAQGVAHRDLKLENVLLNRWGGARSRSSTSASRTSTPRPRQARSTGARLVDMCGSPSYCAPEVRTGQGDGFKADVWSLGVCFFAMLSGFFPLELRQRPALRGAARGAG